MPPAPLDKAEPNLGVPEPAGLGPALDLHQPLCVNRRRWHPTSVRPTAGSRPLPGKVPATPAPTWHINSSDPRGRHTQCNFLGTCPRDFSVWCCAPLGIADAAARARPPIPNERRVRTSRSLRRLRQVCRHTCAMRVSMIRSCSPRSFQQGQARRRAMRPLAWSCSQLRTPRRTRFLLRDAQGDEQRGI